MPKLLFPEGMGGVHNTRGVGGGYFCIQKRELPGRRRGLHEIPSVVGYGYFLELHILYEKGNVVICHALMGF